MTFQHPDRDATNGRQPIDRSGSQQSALFGGDPRTYRYGDDSSAFSQVDEWENYVDEWSRDREEYVSERNRLER